ncbi:metal-dependent hydrolase [Halomonas koreensis]|uniref:Metal-dependent hydrolase n=1 Tax=Halomonas koreensis TaxID=245385 RepID=A0ABU1FWZ7_9GAMM|nr:metal-dependent hydrolase [Halomonas koreensis]MDR5865211.1 metal-dependent hydrolase [Halomonas koreensis]
MDSLTQAALGAAIGGTLLGRRLGRKAVLLGAALGTLPDLDVLIDYGDAVANVTRHRGFSHSLFVLAGLAAALTLLATRLARARDIGWPRWAAFFFLCLLTHPLLDALTTYGTQLWWPLDVRPAAWPLVFIIDPLYSLPLLVGIATALATGNGRRGPAWGLVISCLYLTLALGAKTLVGERLAPVLAEHGLAEAPRLLQPTPFNILLWRATVVEGDRVHEAVIGVFDGEHRPALETYRRGADLAPAARALPAGRRLAWFAGPFLRYERRLHDGRESLVVTDLRLGFPGFHPFRYRLATRRGGDWQPLPATERLGSARDDNRQALARLGRRILSPAPTLCTSRFVSREWRLRAPAACR